MVATVSKSFTFHASHQLPNHDGPCRDLHGHTYVLQVAVTAEVKGADGSSDEGMVMDFGILKDIYKEEIEPKVEHKHLNDTLRDFVPCSPAHRERGPRAITTSENIAMWMLDRFHQGVLAHWWTHRNNIDDAPDTAPIVMVRLAETPTSYAEVWSE